MGGERAGKREGVKKDKANYGLKRKKQEMGKAKKKNQYEAR